MKRPLRDPRFLLALTACTSSPPDTADASEDWLDVEDSLGLVDNSWAANWPSDVEAVGEGAILVRDLKLGAPMELAWAQQSDVACFPGTQNDLFDGAHLLFALQQPVERGLTIRVTPQQDLDLSLYTLQQATTSFQAPPSVSSAVACEASLNGASGEAEEVRIWPSSNPYNLVVGVAGAADQNEGLFLLEVTADD